MSFIGLQIQFQILVIDWLKILVLTEMFPTRYLLYFTYFSEFLTRSPVVTTQMIKTTNAMQTHEERYPLRCMLDQIFLTFSMIQFISRFVRILFEVPR